MPLFLPIILYSWKKLLILIVSIYSFPFSVQLFLIRLSLHTTPLEDSLSRSSASMQPKPVVYSLFSSYSTFVIPFGIVSHIIFIFQKTLLFQASIILHELVYESYPLLHASVSFQLLLASFPLSNHHMLDCSYLSPAFFFNASSLGTLIRPIAPESTVY